MIENERVTGVHDFDWLYTQARDEHSRKLVDRIIKIEKRFLDDDPMDVGTDLMRLRLGENIIWTRDNTTHSIPFGYVQVFKLLDEILPSDFRQPMGNLIVDVGANEGHWSLYMRSKHPSAPIVAIEPNPVPLELLHKNIESNTVQNITVLPVAVCDEAGTKEFETIDNVTSIGSFSIDRGGRPWLTDERINKIKVRCVKLDDVAQLQQARQIDLLKVDVEGAEVEVLEGAKDTLTKTRRIEIEYGSDKNRGMLLSILSSYGFKLLLDHPYSKGRGDLFLSSLL